MGLTKAKLYNLDTNTEVVQCDYNPNELSFSQKNTWQPQKSSGSNLPDVHFQGTAPRTLALTLLFDSYEKPDKDVRKTTDKVFMLMDATGWEQTKKGSQRRPPHVMFRWGSMQSFPAVITDASQKFTLFDESGVPVRATVQVTLQEVPKVATAKQNKGQNPTSRAIDVRRSRVVHPGDTLDFIAADELGDPNGWRRLAEANGIEDPRRLRPGQVLLIPTEG